MAHPPEEDSFLSRWSRRKRASEDMPLPEVAPDDAVSAEETDSISDEDLAALPALDDFTPKTDIRPFLRKGVPNSLRNAALRKMWMLTPAIRDHADPAVDYAWDWNTPGGVPGDGAGPTVERAAEMLRDLVAPRRDAEAAARSELHDKTPDAPPDTTALSAAQHSATPITRDALDPAQEPMTDPAPLYAKPKEKQSDTEAGQVRKRHGGAAPN